MTEPEVSLNIALFYIKNNLTTENVKVSIDGAHAKTKDQVHFDIHTFMFENNCKKIDDEKKRWQGIYEVNGYEPKIEISSAPGIGDVHIQLTSGKQLWIESKKGKTNKSGQEYVLMREAIGQLMTNEKISANSIPIVAIPFSEKSLHLANKWSQLPGIINAGIGFFLVKDSNSIIRILPSVTI